MAGFSVCLSMGVSEERDPGCGLCRGEEGSEEEPGSPRNPDDSLIAVHNDLRGGAGGPVGDVPVVSTIVPGAVMGGMKTLTGC